MIENQAGQQLPSRDAEQYLNSPWEEQVALQSRDAAFSVILHHKFLQPVTFEEDSEEARILNQMHKMDENFAQDLATMDPNTAGKIAKGARLRYYGGLARELKSKRRYDMIGRLVNAVEDNARQLPPSSRETFLYSLTTLHLMMSDKNNFLVGTKNGEVWKNIEWPVTEEGIPRLMETASRYTLYLHLVGRREAAVVPERPARERLIKEARVPKPTRSVNELLEEAWYKQRYLVPTEGAEVRFSKAGDLEKMIVMQAGNIIFGKAFTTYGEFLVALDMDKPRELDYNGSLEGVLAETYRDLVTAVVLGSRIKRSWHQKNAVAADIDEEKPDEDRPQVIYIPRRVRTESHHTNEELRAPYTGPVRPHPVTPHIRAGNMTMKQRTRVAEFEKEHDVDVLSKIPEGITFVLPYVVPEGATLEHAPVFIKVAFERRVEENVRKAEKKLKDRAA